MSEIEFDFSAFFENEKDAETVYNGLMLASEEKWNKANEYFNELNIKEMFLHTEADPCRLFFRGLNRDGKKISGLAINLDDKFFFRSLNLLGGKRIAVDVNNSQVGESWSYGIINGRKVKTQTVVKSLAEDDPKYALILSISSGKTSDTLKILEKGVDPNVYIYGLHALICAVIKNNFKMVEALIKAGADVNAKDNRKIQYEDYRYLNTALHYSLSNSPFKANSKKILNLLIEKGADVNAANYNGEIPLHLAIEKYQINLLLDAGANVNVVDKSGATPIFHYLKLGKAEIAPLTVFIERGAKLDVCDNRGANVLWYATKNPPIFECLENDHGLSLCAPKNAYKGNFTSDLIVSIQHNDKEKFDELVENSDGFDLDAPKDGDDWTPLAYCAVYNAPSFARVLISKGADVNAGNGVALVWASRSNAMEVAELLIENHADILLRDDDRTGIYGTMVPGRDAMFHAIEKKSLSVISLLLDRGWKRENDVMTYALNKLVSLTGVQDSIERFIYLGADSNKIVFDCRLNAVIKAVEGKNVDHIKSIYRNGGIIDGKIALYEGFTTTMHAAASEKKNGGILQFLIDNGVGINAKGSSGITPIMSAIYSGCLDNVKIIVNHGADLSATDSSGKNILQCAKSKKRILKYLNELYATKEYELHSQFDRDEIRGNEPYLCLYSKNSRLISISRLTAYMKKRGWRIIMEPDKYGSRHNDPETVQGRLIGCKSEQFDILKQIAENEDWGSIGQSLEDDVLGSCSLDTYSNWDYETHMIQESLDSERKMAGEKLKPEALDFLFAAKSFYLFEFLGTSKNTLSLEFAKELYNAIGTIMNCIEINWDNYQYRVIS
jgi:ankyrin repeat protein